VKVPSGFIDTVPWAGVVFPVTLIGSLGFGSLSPFSTLPPGRRAAGPVGLVPTPSGVLPTAV
jgi:hypothetical protein